MNADQNSARSLTMTASEMRARRHAALRDGRRAAEERHDPQLEAPPLIELVSWLPDLTVDAYQDPILPRGNRTLQAASAWLSNAALSTHGGADVKAARATACELAQAQLATFAAHGDADALIEAVQRCARGVACALDPATEPAERRATSAAVHAELTTLAVLRSDHAQPLPTTTRRLRPARWATRHVAAAVPGAATAPRSTFVAPGLLSEPPAGDALTGIIAALPALTLDALWLDLDGGGLDPVAARVRLQHAYERAATALYRTEQALAGYGNDTRWRQAISALARMRLADIATSKPGESRIFEGIDRSALCLARALLGHPTETAEMALCVIASELVTTMAVITGCQAANASPRRHGAHTAHAHQRRPRRRP